MPTAIPVPDDGRPFFSSRDEIRHGYHAGDKDEAVRDCADRLDATWPGSGNDPVLFRTLGMLLLAPYVAFGSPGTGVEDRAVAVLRRVAPGGDGRVCAHGRHPSPRARRPGTARGEPRPLVPRGPRCGAGHRNPSARPERQVV
ncbi:hypothetical protein ACIOG7_12360 [Streptomyces sp. NPDC087894]|uniref:hypothetical protein n=1 Tax=Streptomyces sp. NPDC087894 TaxID=3365816 RepID=UPI00380D1B1A